MKKSRSSARSLPGVPMFIPFDLSVKRQGRPDTRRFVEMSGLGEFAKSRGSNAVTCGLSKKELKAATDRLAAIPDCEPRLIIATGRYVGEGFDDSRLDTLFLTMPISWKGTIAQYAGRLHRLHDGKKVVRIYDYADLDVPMLSRMFDRRCEGYEAIGYTILLPASALPGWPVEVPLPLDPLWKNDYAASVRRLIRDGIDPPLARLFVHVTQTHHPEARSASESFLYQRLQTLPSTKDRFQLNAHLPIPFDDRGSLEVDFLCSVKRLVIELDGEQHLGDVDAYRRDRRKDMLLQENGYLILRFLTTDLGKNLDRVLDTIHRALAHSSESSSSPPARIS
ncbi:MAG: DUF559 domain-containing protein [Verrucomicrobia bacterium]|nr:MAG: DUF559 domain-containing protein [Verrucomicrobiota bacterium]